MLPPLILLLLNLPPDGPSLLSPDQLQRLPDPTQVEAMCLPINLRLGDTEFPSRVVFAGAFLEELRLTGAFELLRDELVVSL